MRKRYLRTGRWAGVLALGIAAVLTIVLLIIGSTEPGRAIRAFLVAPLVNRYYLGNMLNSMSGLVIAGLGIAIAFRAGLYNLGGEGQIYISAFVATAAALALPRLPGPIGVFIVLLCAIATGAALAGLSGVLRHLWNAPELITSYLLSAAIIPTVDYLVTGPANDPARNLLATRTIPERYFLPELLAPSELNVTLIIALVLAVVVFIVMYRSVSGYELRLFGLNDEFARYAGISAPAYTIGSMAVSGGLHGLTGGLMVMGTYHATIVGFSGGVGWNAIAVALIGHLQPLGVVPAALAFSYLEAGGKAALLHTDFSFELGSVIQATVFFLVTARVLIRRKRS